ncbi:nitrous oxide reductase accessory protein NosL [Paracoccus shandongensis]|uniref:nitrous oxide reductase accessory protein NosL n=1 Tax=Paracoccus shandongensis TaxID=2816048 RepID=UPI001A8C90BC|nr:nitrous oxide reductase accessory protein NosL [Paracoccus shandongensis]
MKPVLILALCLSLAACKPEVAQDTTPVELTAETLGHFCQMNLLEHPGPKAQVHLEGMPGTPLFFSQVRDAIAYARLPEQSHPILAIQVNDMAVLGATWEVPGRGNWIDADDAFFVLGSAREGGMGAPEAVPFGTREAAEAFAAQEGGTVMRLSQIPDDLVLTPEETAPADTAPDADFENRLRALSRPEG